MRAASSLLGVTTTTRQSGHLTVPLWFRCSQTEFGDIYRVTLKHEQDKVDEVIVKYFDTVPPSKQALQPISSVFSMSSNATCQTLD